MLSDAQVKLMRLRRMEGKTQQAAAAAAGMSERSARKWEAGPLPTEAKGPRMWRTRPDPFAEVWERDLVPLLERDEKGVLQATTLLEVLQERHAGRFVDAQVRTLQRRLRDWRAIHGPEKEVFFEQVHVPGREAAIDFTHGTELGVTVRGMLLVHLLFEFVLSFSGWTWVCLAFAETFEALVAGLQGALWDLGGVTEVVRSDNLSAATHELKLTGGRELTKRFQAVLDHYGLRSTRIRPGESHENGVVEQRHFRTKQAIAEALVVRGSREFDSADAYAAFVRDVVDRSHNRKVVDALAVERDALQPLPPAPVPSYSTYRPQVRRWSTIRVGGRTYSVPSRLIGHEVEARQHPDVVEVYYRGRLVEAMPRIRGEGEARIDYRHVIWSLVRKPGAFARYRYREELFPTLVFRRAYDALRAARGDRADVEYVRTLHLAASTLEADVERALATLLERGEPFDYAAVKALASPEQPRVPAVAIPAVDLGAYDRLLGGAP
jgi:DNA-binding XRE family transcriptional regulator